MIKVQKIFKNNNIESQQIILFFTFIIYWNILYLHFFAFYLNIFSIFIEFKDHLSFLRDYILCFRACTKINIINKRAYKKEIIYKILYKK